MATFFFQQQKIRSAAESSATFVIDIIASVCSSGRLNESFSQQQNLTECLSFPLSQQILVAHI